MKREVSCEGDRGKATRVATKYDAVCEVTTDHYRGADLRLRVARDGRWKLAVRVEEGVMEHVITGTINNDGMVTIDK